MRRDDHFGWSADGVAIIPMIETVEAVANLDDDPRHAGHRRHLRRSSRPVGLTRAAAEATTTTEPSSPRRWRRSSPAAARPGVVPGIHATAQLVERRLEQGFRMITVTSDMLAMRGMLADDLAVARGAKPAEAKSGAMYCPPSRQAVWLPLGCTTHPWARGCCSRRPSTNRSSKLAGWAKPAAVSSGALRRPRLRRRGRVTRLRRLPVDEASAEVRPRRPAWARRARRPPSANSLR